MAQQDQVGHATKSSGAAARGSETAPGPEVHRFQAFRPWAGISPTDIMSPMRYARVLTFHVDVDDLPELIEAMDEATERLSESPNFGGLLCLEEEGPRQKITVISLWDAEGLEATAAEGDAARRHIAATADLGVISQIQKVIRFTPGPDGAGLTVPVVCAPTA